MMESALTQDFEQPTTFAFDAESEAEAARHIAKYPPGRQASAVIPLLYLVQEQMGRQTGSAWIPLAGMNEVARRLDMAPIRVYEAATFYTMFNLRPIGKWHLQVCTTTPCWLRGSDDVVTRLSRIDRHPGLGRNQRRRSVYDDRSRVSWRLRQRAGPAIE